MTRTFSLIAFMLTATPFIASAQSGGPYQITQSVIAGGGSRNASGGTYSLDSTAGQAVAGSSSFGGGFSIQGGFWAQGPMAPTAAPVSIRGRVMTAAGRGISGAVINIILPHGSQRTAMTNTFGFYRLTGITAGLTYVVSVSSRRHVFPTSSLAITPVDNVTGLDFVASN